MNADENKQLMSDDRQDGGVVPMCYHAFQQVGAGAVVEDDLFEGHDQPAGISRLAGLAEAEQPGRMPVNWTLMSSSDSPTAPPTWQRTGEVRRFDCTIHMYAVYARSPG